MKTIQDFSVYFLRSYDLVFSLEDTNGVPYSAQGLAIIFHLSDSNGNTITKTNASGVTIDGDQITISLLPLDMEEVSGSCPYTLTIDGEVMASGTGTIDDSRRLWVISRNGSVPPELSKEWQEITTIQLEASLNTEFEWFTAGGLIDASKLIGAYGFAIAPNLAAALLDESLAGNALSQTGSAISLTTGKGLGGFSDLDYLSGSYNWSTNYAYALSWREVTPSKNYYCPIGTESFAIQALINTNDGVNYLVNNNRTWSPARNRRGVGIMNLLTARFNGEDAGVAGAGYGTYTGSNWRIGRAYAANNWPMSSGYLCGLAVFNAALSVNEANSLDACMRWMRKPRYILGFEGDSITAGYAIAVPYPQTLTDALENYYPVDVNWAVTGAVLSDLVARAATVDAHLLSISPRHILTVFAGTNDLLTRSTAATYADLVSYCQARQAAGWDVIVVTCLPRDESAAWKTKRASYNALIAANYLTFADAIADVAADSRIGDDLDCFDTTYYQADKIHPNQTGADVIASIVQPVVESLL